MREIKFRAWDKVNKEMFTGLPYSNAKGNDTFDMVLKHPQIYEVMQFTGLKDKNGCQIYEGDIVGCKDYTERVGIVKFGKHKSNDMSNNYECGNLGFYIEFNDDMSLLRQDIYFWHGLGIEAIGNIYESEDICKR